MRRRGYLATVAGTVSAIVAGCVGGDNVVVSGSTREVNDWEVELEGGETMELEVTLESGVVAMGSISHIDETDPFVTVEIEDFENDDVTESTEFTVPETGEYFVALSVDTDGRGSLTLREV